ncbi:MAG: universal stress protein [Phycisphaeraceae bacterium]
MKHLLVPIDFSDTTAPIIQTVESIARAFDCTVHYLHVVPSVADKGEWDLMRHAQSQFSARYPNEFRRIQAMASELRERGCEADALILQGPVVPVILHEIERLNADFVIIGSHGHGALYDMLVGSVCEGVLRKATCPVIVVPGLARMAARAERGETHAPAM